ncbi:helix-turn-helix domain-containing protein [Catenuloplanes sp. NPDC051500]|uniref:helix-turn-helix domain-containing protein n=1 Tax=Catenuloplanes sp. NPDC051500 TaxID=3363959 RepID=UPI0037A55E83
MIGTDVGFLSVDNRREGDFGDVAAAWQQRMGDRFAMPSFAPATTSGFRAKMDALRLYDVVYNSIDTVSAIQTTGFATTRDLVRVWIVRRGAWLLGDAHGTEQRVTAGRVLVSIGPMTHLIAEPGTRTDLLVLPTPTLGARRRSAAGSASQAEVRLLLAHATMVRECAGELGSAGLHAARNTFVELVRAVTDGGVDAVEPRLTPALARAARTLADQLITHPGLSPSLLARELNVSVRTLQRAFAAEGGSVAGYLRERRLAEARSALAATGTRLAISDVAARWQFADASHFTREFRRRYGLTPGEFVRQRQSNGRPGVPPAHDAPVSAAGLIRRPTPPESAGGDAVPPQPFPIPLVRPLTS